jgi:outer membrane protein OmpA-like peptidoglycan-associated protein
MPTPPPAQRPRARRFRRAAALGAAAALSGGALAGAGLAAEPSGGTLTATGVATCTPAAGTVQGMTAAVWYISDDSSPSDFGPLTDSFDGPADASGFPTRVGEPVPEQRTDQPGGNSNNLSRAGNAWDALRVEGWVAPPCEAASTWELRFRMGSIATYVGALRQGALATIADARTTGGTAGQQVSGGLEVTAPVAMGLADPVSAVALIDDRGGQHAMIVEESIDGGDWAPVPAERIWGDLPVAPPPPPPTGPTVVSTGRFAGTVGTTAVFVGSGFGARQGDSVVTVGGVSVGTAPVWRDNRVEFAVPDLAPGAHPVVITVNGVSTAVGEYVVGETPPAPPIANPVLLPAGGATVEFDGTLTINPNTGATAAGLGRLRQQATGITGISSLIWRFGDGTSSRQPAVSKTYTSPGTYNASLTVTDSSGASATTTQTITVRRSGRRLVAALPPVNLTIPNRVVFDFGSATIRAEAEPVLVKLSGLLRRIGRRAIVGGHTDSIGSAGYNTRLSERRAKAVRAFLVQRGKVSPLLLAAVGYGESAPLDTNSTALGRQRNRRVTLRVVRTKSPARLDGRTLQINQRIATAVLLRERALRERLERGLDTTDLQNGTFFAGTFGPGVDLTGGESAVSAAPVRPRPVRVAQMPSARRNFPFNRRQLRVNARIGRTAVVRVNALIERLDRGLTGADVRNGAITGSKLVPGLRFASVSSSGAVQTRAPFSVPRIPSPKLPRGPVTEAQLLADQRRSQAAMRRINILTSRFAEGFAASDFVGGSLGPQDVAGG